MKTTNDINTDNKIRLTDNRPKEGDIYIAYEQYPKPMSKEAIKEKMDSIKRGE